MRAIGQHQHAARVAGGGDGGQRQHQGAVRCHVIDDRQPGSRPDGPLDGCHQRVVAGARERDRRASHPRPRPGGDIARRLDHSAVAVAQQQNFVAGREIQRAQHRVAAGGGVFDEHHILAARAQERRQMPGGGAQGVRQFSGHEP